MQDNLTPICFIPFFLTGAIISPTLIEDWLVISLVGGGRRRGRLHTEESHGTRYPLAAVWEEILAGTFSTIGRMERLSKCFEPPTRLYMQQELPNSNESADLDAAIRAVHVLVWKDWLSGSLERQQARLARVRLRVLRKC